MTRTATKSSTSRRSSGRKNDRSRSPGQVREDATPGSAGTPLPRRGKALCSFGLPRRPAAARIVHRDRLLYAAHRISDSAENAESALVRLIAQTIVAAMTSIPEQTKATGSARISRSAVRAALDLLHTSRFQSTPHLGCQQALDRLREKAFLRPVRGAGADCRRARSGRHLCGSPLNILSKRVDRLGL